MTLKPETKHREAPAAADPFRRPFRRDVIALFGLPFDLMGLEAAAKRVAAAAAKPERLFLSTANLDWLVTCRTDEAFRASVLASDLVTMDGVPVVQLARLAGAKSAEKVAGSDLFERLRDEDLSVFFFGGREGAAQAASAVLERDRSGRDGRGMRAAGHHNPGFGDARAMSAPEHLKPVNAASADLLVAALGAAKGQAWLLANQDALAPPVRAHLGAVVDFVAGTVRRAPRAMQTAGLEWAWRIGQDRKLWRRYATDAAVLPRLIAEARRIDALSKALARKAGPARIALGEGPDEGVLRLCGRPERGALADALRRALAARRPLTVRLEAGTAPDLRLLGLLLLGEIAFVREGLRYETCCEDEEARNLCALTMGRPVPRLVNGA